MLLATDPRRPADLKRWARAALLKIGARTQPTARAEKARLRIRLRTMLFGFYAAVFWSALLVLYAWLVHIRLGWVGFAVLVVWVALSLPALLVQLATIADLLLYVTLRRIVVFPIMRAVHTERTRRELDWWDARTATRRLALVTIRTSPLSGIATWCFVTLCRLPESAYAEWSERRVSELEQNNDASDGRFFGLFSGNIFSWFATYWGSLERNGGRRVQERYA